MYVGDDCPTHVRLPVDEHTARDFADRLRQPRSRAARLARIKHAIEQSEYENPLKLSVALDRLVDSLTRNRD